MKAIKKVLLGSIISLAVPFALADDHATFTGGMDPAEPMSVQANLCTLNDGVSLSDYEKFFDRYRKWAKQNDA